MVQAMKRQKREYRLISSCLSRLAVLLLTGLLLPFAGCGRAGYLDEKERNNRLLAKAYEMVDLGEYDAASLLFRKTLDTHPTMARPHLDLALVLHDRQKDYLRAIYHYNRYLELRPGTEKDDMIRARMQQAERAFVASRVTVNGADGPSAMQLLDENNSLRSRVESLEKTVAAREKELVAFRESERRRLRDQVMTGGTAAVTGAVPPVVVDAPLAEKQGLDRATLEPVSEPAVEPVSPPVPIKTVTRPVVPEASQEVTIGLPSLPSKPSVTVPSNTVDEVAIVRTYTVQRGDTLSRIAFKVYGDATRWRGIQEANSAVLGDSVNVRVGQVLIIP